MKSWNHKDTARDTVKPKKKFSENDAVKRFFPNNSKKLINNDFMERSPEIPKVHHKLFDGISNVGLLDTAGLHHIVREVKPFQLESVNNSNEINTPQLNFQDFKRQTFGKPTRSSVGQSVEEKQPSLEKSLAVDSEPNKHLINRLAQTKTNGDINIDISTINRLKVRDFDKSSSLERDHDHWDNEELTLGNMWKKVPILTIPDKSSTKTHLATLKRLNTEVEKRNKILVDKILEKHIKSRKKNTNTTGVKKISGQSLRQSIKSKPQNRQSSSKKSIPSSGQSSSRPTTIVFGQLPYKYSSTLVKRHTPGMFSTHHTGMSSRRADSSRMLASDAKFYNSSGKRDERSSHKFNIEINPKVIQTTSRGMRTSVKSGRSLNTFKEVKTDRLERRMDEFTKTLPEKFQPRSTIASHFVKTELTKQGATWSQPSQTCLDSPPLQQKYKFDNR